MKTASAKRRRRYAPVASLLVSAGITATGMASTFVAAAAPGQIVDMNAQCRAQYPGNAEFLPAEAYLVAPRDAYSWRCKRTSTSPNGGIITDLTVDPNAYCPTGRAVVSATSPPNWECA